MCCGCCKFDISGDGRECEGCDLARLCSCESGDSWQTTRGAFRRAERYVGGAFTVVWLYVVVYYSAGIVCDSV